MKNYIEKELKILEVDPAKTTKLLEKLGAKKVFDGERTIIHFDYPNRRLRKENKDLRLTIEEGFKLSIDTRQDDGSNTSIKLKVSRDTEAIELLKAVGLEPIAKVEAHRYSFELGKTDFDIDVFLGIPAFLEVDCEDLSKAELEELLQKLDIVHNKRVTLSTKEIFKEYGKDYWELFTTNP